MIWKKLHNVKSNVQVEFYFNQKNIKLLTQSIIGN